MSPVSISKFWTCLERSKLVEENQFQQLVADWNNSATDSQRDDAQACADHLISAGMITAWQGFKLLDGRYRGFFLGKYKLLEHLGSGGMSSVYLAEHMLMQRQVAIKVLPQNRVSDASYLARFHYEGQAAAALDHRNIVRAYDLDNDGRIHYLVMEYIEGRDLYALVRSEGPLDFHTAADYIAQAAGGLDHAHHAGLVHRDIKPANLLVDLKGTIKILDMGLAKFVRGKAADQGFAQDEHILGTADYLAPEQAVNSQTVDHRADIYALGCSLYFVLTGHPPFAGTSLERMTAHQQQVAPSILLDRPDAPPVLVAICRRMMEKSPNSRYQTAAEAQHALQAWLQSEQSLGRVAKNLVAVKPGSPRPSHLEHGGSKLNIVSGSASDLHSVSDATPLSSELQETDPNMQRATVRMPSRAVDPEASDSRSDVFHHGVRSIEAPLEPPAVASPPLDAPPPTSVLRVPWPQATDSHAVTLGATSTGSDEPNPGELLPRESRSRGESARTRRVRSLAIWLLSAMILTAMLLALFTLPQ